MVVIAVLSGARFGADHTGAWVVPLLQLVLPAAGPGLLEGLHAVLRKTAHVTEYAVLGVLWCSVLARGRRPWQAIGWAIGLAALYAMMDEAHQAFVPNRTPAVRDVALDTVGAVLGVSGLAALEGGPAVAALRLLQGAMLAFAVASLAVAMWDWTLAAPAWDLVAAGLGAGIAAGGLRPDRGRPARAALAEAVR